MDYGDSTQGLSNTQTLYRNQTLQTGNDSSIHETGTNIRNTNNIDDAPDMNIGDKIASDLTSSIPESQNQVSENGINSSSSKIALNNTEYISPINAQGMNINSVSVPGLNSNNSESGKPTVNTIVVETTVVPDRDKYQNAPLSGALERMPINDTNLQEILHKLESS